MLVAEVVSDVFVVVGGVLEVSPVMEEDVEPLSVTVFDELGEVVVPDPEVVLSLLERGVEVIEMGLEGLEGGLVRVELLVPDSLPVAASVSELPKVVSLGNTVWVICRVDGEESIVVR